MRVFELRQMGQRPMIFVRLETIFPLREESGLGKRNERRRKEGNGWEAID